MSRGLVAYWVLVVVTAAVYVSMVVWTGPKITYEAGGAMPFDTRLFGYNEAQARIFLGALSDEGRDFYLGVQQRVDMVFPVLFALVMGIAIFWLYAEKSRAMRVALLLLPALGALADYVENARVAALLRSESPAAAMIAAASQATVLKFIFIAASLGLILVGVVGNWRAR